MIQALGVFESDEREAMIEACNGIVETIGNVFER